LASAVYATGCEKYTQLRKSKWPMTRQTATEAILRWVPNHVLRKIMCWDGDNEEKYKDTMLHWMLRCSPRPSCELVRRVLEEDVEAVKVRGMDGMLPLQCAVHGGVPADVATLKLLLNHYADAAADTCSDDKHTHTHSLGFHTPVCLSLLSEQVNAEIVNFLCESHMEVVRRSDKLVRATCENFDHLLGKALSKPCCRLDVVQTLLRHVPASMKQDLDSSKLLKSALRGNASLEVVQLLMQEFPRAAEKFNALHEALEGQCALEVIKFLIEKFPRSVTEEDQDGNLALSIALSARPQVVTTVLEAYPEASKHKNKAGILPLELALKKKGRNLNLSIFKILLKAVSGRLFFTVLSREESCKSIATFLAYKGVYITVTDDEISWQAVNGLAQQCKPEAQELANEMAKLISWVDPEAL
jgi:hypothetical protein